MKKESAYASWLRSISCIICRNPEVQLHHWQKKGHGYMGGKVEEKRLIPLCHSHHKDYHDKGRETFSLKYGVDIENVIERLEAVWLSITKPAGISSR